MFGKQRDELDIVKEFRLRRWAREHHVPPAERRASWHPVVLDEMSRKDDEMLIRARSRGPVSSFVPLVPTVIQRVRPHQPAPAAPVSVPVADRFTGMQRSDLPHESLVSHVGAAITPASSIGSVQVTIVGD